VAFVVSGCDSSDL